jgi:hypothetical protein
VSTQDWDAVPYAGPPPSGSPQPAPSWPAPQPYAPQPYGQPAYGQPAYGQQPAFGQQPWGAPPWPPQPYGAQPPWGAPPWGQPQPWGPPPGPQRSGPQRSGLDVAGAVLAFVSMLLVLVGTVYALAFSALLSLARGPSAGVGGWTAALHLVLAGLLAAGGVRVLSGSRWWLLGAAVLQFVLSLYWIGVLDDIAPSTLGEGVFVLPALYGVLAVLAGGLPFLPELQQWLRRRTERRAPEPPPQPEPPRPPWA